MSTLQHAEGVLNRAPTGVPRLLASDHGFSGSMLAAHEAQHGPIPPLPKTRHERELLLDAIERSGLRGRGGSGFPTATKMRAVSNGRRGRIVVANGCEGEPASRKDALLLTAFPHLVLDGAILAAAAIDAAEIIVALDRSTPEARAGVVRAIEARRVERLEQVPIRIVEVPSRYVAGEESVLVHFLNGGDAKPTIVPPRPYERGVRGRPTLVQNVETLANVALIARNGADWFRLVGTTEEPGTALVTIGGAVNRPGVYEIALGTPVSDVVTAAGGLTDDISAFLVGGYFGTWIPVATGWDMRLTHNDLRAARSTFGCGVIYAFPASACGIAETARIARYLAEETAGQCGSCVNGLASIASSLDSIAAGKNLRFESGRIARWSRQVEGRGACHLPDGAVRLVGTALDVFSEHLELHYQRGRCRQGRHLPVLPLPSAERREWNWR